MFELDDGNEPAAESTFDAAWAEATGSDLRPPEAPPAPEDFSAEDLALREALCGFYQVYRPDNLENVNKITAKYRGRGVSTLWASLCLKYDIPAHEAVDMLSRTLYVSSPFEYQDDTKAEQLSEGLAEIQAKAPSCGAGSGPTSDRAELLRRAVQVGANDGSDALLRMLCFRGIPDSSGLRAQVWKVLLGYLPMARHSEWSAIQGEKRALYASYRSELQAEDESSKELLQEIQNDVERTRKDFEYFTRPETRKTLETVLFVYARLNPGVRYVQGMNEVAAIILYVLSVDAESAEADTFWCFSELMVEIKEGFMQAMDQTAEGVHALVDGVTHLLRSYDMDLANHLKKSELPPFIWVFRWCTVLFAQDLTLPDCMRLWDSLIADPNRFQFVVHVAVALVLEERSELLGMSKQFELAEALQGAPRKADTEALLRRSYSICAFERRVGAPQFPPKPPMDELTEALQVAAAVASEAAARAHEVGEVLYHRVQEDVAPAVAEKAAQLSASVAVKAADAATAAQHWLEETAPVRQQAYAQASTSLSSLWDTVRTTGAVAVSKASEIAATVGEGSDDAPSATAEARIRNAAASAGGTATALFGRASALLSATLEGGEAAPSAHAPEPQASASAPAAAPVTSPTFAGVASDGSAGVECARAGAAAAGAPTAAPKATAAAAPAGPATADAQDDDGPPALVQAPPGK